MKSRDYLKANAYILQTLAISAIAIFLGFIAMYLYSK